MTAVSQCLEQALPMPRRGQAAQNAEKSVILAWPMLAFSYYRKQQRMRARQPSKPGNRSKKKMVAG
ncbi:MAG: hypothetical protein ACRYGK_07300 [Janthinobacterium lividum]